MLLPPLMGPFKGIRKAKHAFVFILEKTTKITHRLLLLFSGVLEGLGRSWRLVGIVSTNLDTSETSWCRVIVNKKQGSNSGNES